MQDIPTLYERLNSLEAEVGELKRLLGKTSAEILKLYNKCDCITMGALHLVEAGIKADGRIEALEAKLPER